MKLGSKTSFFATLMAVAMGVIACGPQTGEAPAPGEGDTATGGGQTVAISGAGATFPAPLYQRWFAAYNQDVDPNVQVSYQSVGSGAGLEQYINGTVDFGASDAPIEGDRLESFRAKYGYDPIQIPMAGGFLAFAHNIPGVEDAELQLSREVYCGIVEGRITNWNDPAIAADNPNIEFPNLPIIWAHRSDGSGTTFVFVNHINTVCPDWPSGVGTSVDWPVGQGGQGNEGVTAIIQQNEGAIGYVEFAYAKLNELPVAEIENQAGNFLYPSPEAASAALDGEEIPEDFGLLVPDPDGEDAYPIVGLTWILVYREYEDAQKWQTMREVFEWCLTDGQNITTELDYVPMPDSIIERIRQVLDEVNA
jgi:phosphate transport system substrate-binding protein